MSDLTNERHLALVSAVQLHQAVSADTQAVVRTAVVFWEFLTAAVTLLITAGPVIDQATGRPTNTPGGTGMTVIKDTEKFPLLVKALDAKGNAVTAPTDVTFTSSDTAVVTISDPDGSGTRWAIAVQPGSAVVTGDWPGSPHGDLQGTLAVDVTVGDAASLVIGAGDAVPQ